MTSTIIGATNLDQLKENIQAFEIELSPEILQGIEAIHIQQPNPAHKNKNGCSSIRFNISSISVKTYLRPL